MTTSLVTTATPSEQKPRNRKKLLALLLLLLLFVVGGIITLLFLFRPVTQAPLVADDPYVEPEVSVSIDGVELSSNADIVSALEGKTLAAFCGGEVSEYYTSLDLVPVPADMSVPDTLTGDGIYGCSILIDSWAQQEVLYGIEGSGVLPESLAGSWIYQQVIANSLTGDRSYYSYVGVNPAAYVLYFSKNEIEGVDVPAMNENVEAHDVFNSGFNASNYSLFIQEIAGEATWVSDYDYESSLATAKTYGSVVTPEDEAIYKQAWDAAQAHV